MDFDTGSFFRGLLAGQRLKAWAAGAEWPEDAGGEESETTNEAAEGDYASAGSGEPCDTENFLAGLAAGRALEGWPVRLNDGTGSGGSYSGVFSVGGTVRLSAAGGLVLPPPMPIAVASFEEA